MRQITVVGPAGQAITRGKIVVENGVHIWEAQVEERRHLFRRLNSWTVSADVLRQLKTLGVDLIRYVVADRAWEIYEVEVDKFVALAEELDQTGWKPSTERQYALPRRFWERRESAHANQQLALALA
jgi:hypothetical protein